jgi:hypothetical protein
MATTKPEETIDVVEDVEEVTPDIAEEETPVEVVEATDGDLPKIESLEDVKDFLNEGIDKIRDSSMEEIRTGALGIANRVLGKLRKLTEDD